jgi:hypothetical protein
VCLIYHSIPNAEQEPGTECQVVDNEYITKQKKRKAGRKEGRKEGRKAKMTISEYLILCLSFKRLINVKLN